MRFIPTAVSMMIQRVQLVEWMTRLKRAVVAVSGWAVGRGRGATVSLRHLACATKRIANIACLAFSEGNRSIDFWLCSLFYLHRRAPVPGE